MNYEFSENKKGRRRGGRGWREGEGGHYPIKPSPLIINKNSNMSEKIDYKPVEGTGVLTSSIYDDGNILVLGASTHLALIEGGNKFAALEIIKAQNKSGDTLVLQAQPCEDGNFSVLAISSLKVKRVYSSEQVTSSKRMSGGMSIAQILSLEAGVQYRLTKTQDGFKKPFGWKEGDPLQQNNSYRLEAVTVEPTVSQPTTTKK